MGLFDALRTSQKDTVAGVPLPQSEAETEAQIKADVAKASENIFDTIRSKARETTGVDVGKTQEPTSEDLEGAAVKVFRGLTLGFGEQLLSMLPQDTQNDLRVSEAEFERRSPTGAFVSEVAGFGTPISTVQVGGKALTAAVSGTLRARKLKKFGLGGRAIFDAIFSKKPSIAAFSGAAGALSAKEASDVGVDPRDAALRGLGAGLGTFILGGTTQFLFGKGANFLGLSREEGLGLPALNRKLRLIHKDPEVFGEIRNDRELFMRKLVDEFDPQGKGAGGGAIRRTVEFTAGVMNRAVGKTVRLMNKTRQLLNSEFGELEKSVKVALAKDPKKPTLFSMDKTLATIDDEIRARFGANAIGKNGNLTASTASRMSKEGLDPATVIQVRRTLRGNKTGIRKLQKQAREGVVDEALSETSSAVPFDDILTIKRLLARKAGPDFAGKGKAAGFNRFLWDSVDDGMETIAKTDSDMLRYLEGSRRYSRARTSVDEYQQFFAGKNGKLFRQLRADEFAHDEHAGLTSRFTENVRTGNDKMDTRILRSFAARDVSNRAMIRADILLENLPKDRDAVLNFFLRVGKDGLFNPTLEAAGRRNPAIGSLLAQARQLKVADEFFGSTVQKASSLIQRFGLTGGKIRASIGEVGSLTEGPKKLAKQAIDEPLKFQVKLLATEVANMVGMRGSRRNEIIGAVLQTVGFRGAVTPRAVLSFIVDEKNSSKTREAIRVYKQMTDGIKAKLGDPAIPLGNFEVPSGVNETGGNVPPEARTLAPQELERLKREGAFQTIQ